MVKNYSMTGGSLIREAKKTKDVVLMDSKGNTLTWKNLDNYKTYGVSKQDNKLQVVEIQLVMSLRDL